MSRFVILGITVTICVLSILLMNSGWYYASTSSDSDGYSRSIDFLAMYGGYNYYGSYSYSSYIIIGFLMTPAALLVLSMRQASPVVGISIAAFVVSAINTVTAFVHCIGLSIQMKQASTRSDDSDYGSSTDDRYLTVLRLPVAGIWLLFFSQVSLLVLSLWESKRSSIANNTSKEQLP